MRERNTVVAIDRNATRLAARTAMWGTYLLDAYRQQDARDMLQAIEAVLGPKSGSSWATGGVYVFWHAETRKPLYVGIAGDLPVRFAQHNGLRSCPEKGCKRKQISAHFAQNEWLGYTIIPLSSLSQPNTARFRDLMSKEERELFEADQYFAEEAIDEIRALEGKLIASNSVRFGHVPPWNTSPGRLPDASPAVDDGTLATAVGALDILLQARRPIRDLAANGLWAAFEEHLHGVRMISVRMGILGGKGVRNDLIRADFERMPANRWIHDAIVDEQYLDQRNPLTIGPVAEPPPGE